VAGVGGAGAWCNIRPPWAVALPSLIMVVVVDGGLSRDLGRGPLSIGEHGGLPCAAPGELPLRHIVALVMSVETNTQRVHRTWFERLKLWRHAYETKVFDHRHETVGRGPSPAAARDAALKRWNEQIERWKEQNAENK
jgi:hypothetical protein